MVIQADASDTRGSLAARQPSRARDAGHGPRSRTAGAPCLSARHSSRPSGDDLKRPACRALVLAGGLARRMGGGDKPLREIGGHTILARVDRAARAAMRGPASQRQWRSLALRVVRPAGRRRWGEGIIQARSPESWPGSIGPQPTGPNAQWILSAPGDCPFLPRDLVVATAPSPVAKTAELGRRGLPRAISSCDRAVEGRAARRIA